MMTTLLLIYLILLCWYSFCWLRKNVNLVVCNYGQLMIQSLGVVSFFVLFVFGLRILNLFRVYKVIDLKLICSLNNLIVFVLFFIFVYSLRKLIIYVFKLCFFKLHYVLLSPYNFSIANIYAKIYYNLVYSPAFIIFKYLVFINYIVIFVLLIVFLYDILINNFVLNYSLWYLKFYSLFRLFYLCCFFMVKKQILLLDYYSYNLFYPGDPENSFFINFKDADHFMLIDESKKYTEGVILEIIEYKPKYFGNTKEMAYFKKLEDFK